MSLFRLFSGLSTGIVLAAAATLSADDLPSDSQSLLDKFVEFETKELNEAKQRVEEKKQLVIEHLKTHFERESKAGNRDAALAVLSEIEELDGGQRRHTQGLERMVPLAKPGAGPDKPEVKIPDGATRVGSSYYLMFPDRVTRTEAAERCQKMGGKLAAITTERIFEDYVDDARKRFSFNALWTSARFDKGERKWAWEEHPDRFNTDFLRERGDISDPPYEFLVMDINTGELFPKAEPSKQCFICQWDK
ncbi:MAG: C-type lectin domain-containing protein [Verrucomicrobiota bacterium]